MYSRNGGIDVADIDAITNTRKFPLEWTLKPWTRPDGRPDVFIRPDWNELGVQQRIDLARSTMNGQGLEIETDAQAVETISGYLAGTRHPSIEGSST
jgi:hypothetical protein